MPSFLPPHSFPPANERERAELLAWVRDVPLVYGAWTHWKSLWKAAEAAFVQSRSEPELWTALLSRIGDAPLHGLTPKSDGIAPGSFSSLALHPNQPLLYALRDDGTVSIFEVSEPVQPRLVGSFQATTAGGRYNYGALRIVGDVLLHLHGEARAFDLSDALNPQFFASLNFYGNYAFPHNTDGEPYFLVSSYNELSTFQIPSKTNRQWTALSTSPKETTYHGATHSDGSLVVSLMSQWSRGGYKHEFSLLDASDPRNIVELAKVKAKSGLFQVRDRLIYQLDGNTFSVIDVRDPSNTREVGKLGVGRNNGSALYLQGDIAVLVCGNSYYSGQDRAMVLIDIAGPRNPRVIGELSTLSWFPVNLVRTGDLAFASTNKGLRALEMGAQSRITEVGQSPSPRTFAYLKRRGRRFARILAESDEEASFELTTRLIETLQGREALDFTTQWIMADALVGAGRAFEQLGHGRGAVVPRPVFHRRTRLERVPAMWDTHRETVERWADEEYPWQVNVVARRVLGQTDAPLSTRQLDAILRGDWPFALLQAARQAQSRPTELAPDALAKLLWCINRRRRNEVLRILGSVERNGALATGLANVLARRAPKRGSFGRRERDIALLLAARFDLSRRDFSARDALGAVPVLLSSNEVPLRELGFAFCRRLSPEAALEAAKLAPRIEVELLPRFYAALGESGQGGRFQMDILTPAIRHTDERVRRAMWAVIRGSKTTNANLRELWTSLLRAAALHYNYNDRTYRWVLSSALQTALDSDDALAVLGRAGADAKELKHLRFQASEPAAPAGLFGAWALFADVKSIVAQVATVTAENWSAWRAAFVRALPFSPARVGEFWEGVRQYLEDASTDHNTKDQLRARTFGDPVVAATFAGAVSSLAPTLLVGVIASITDETWATWRVGLLQTLQEDAARRQAFWDAVRSNGFDDVLRGRLIEDAEFAATFGLLPSVLEFDEPTLEPLLMAWLQRNREQLSSDDALSAALHSLSTVRDFGLRYLQEQGLTTPVALRLVESRLPEPMRVAQEWFEQTATNEPTRAVALALSLLDSPLAEPRDIGRRFVASRLEALMEGGLLEALLENPNAEIQAYVAGLLLEREAEAAKTQEFDRAVLRGRDRARRAKTLVQTRRSQNESLPDKQTLLELARGKTPRDADWAWTQLARLAQNEAVENVEVSGVGAI